MANWTDDQIRYLKDNYVRMSASEIANTMPEPRKFSRSAVCGMANRLGLDGSARLKVKKLGRPPKPKAAKQVLRKRPSFGSMPFVNRKLISAPLPVEQLEQAIDLPNLWCEPVGLIELQSHHCRWPVGDKFCARDKMAPYPFKNRLIEPPYCPGHYKLGIQRDVETEMNLPQYTGTVSQAEADAQTERVKAIMAETGLNFGDACNVYIREQVN